MRGFKTWIVTVALVLLHCGSFTTAQTDPAHTVPTILDPPPDPKICRLCVCSDLVPDKPIAINCASVGLKSVPVELLRELEDRDIEVSRIDLSNNHITHVQASDFHPIRSKLETIDLRWNVIKSIEDKAFSLDYFTHLVTLQLGHNHLRSLPKKVMENLMILTLDLSHNLFTSVPTSALAGAKTIQTLLLNNNPLYNLDDGSLTGISDVVTLDLSACELSVFNVCRYDRSFFFALNYLYLDLNNFTKINKSHLVCPPIDLPPVLGVLKTLSMRYSGITSIERKSFTGTPQLEHLLLTGNNLGIFKGQVFNKLTELTELDLSRCNITDLKGVLFKGSKLTRLFLNHNNIDVVHNGDFRFVDGIQRLDLSWSNVKRIDGAPFENLTDLHRLTLANNQLDDRSIQGLGRKGNFYSLDLSNNKFTRVPNLRPSGFRNLEDLFMSNNSIQRITTADLEGMTNLRTLELDGNRINFIEDDAFSGIPNINNLDLDNMSIGQLPRLPLPKLVTLYLRFGRLESLPEDLCEQCPRLQNLEVDYNRLTALPSFRGCTMDFVHAVDNHIVLDNDTFEGQRSLHFLNLAHNGFSSIPDGFFRDTINLRQIFLRGNNLASLPTGIFSTMPHLFKVDLGENKLSHLEENLFKNQVDLKILELDHNYITRFGPTVLPVNSTLGRLLLSDNNLNEVSLPSGGLPGLLELELDGNPNLLQVPDIAEYPNVTSVKYSYAYHCCIWKDYVSPHPFVDHDLVDNNTKPTEIPTAPPFEEIEGMCGPDGNFTEESIRKHQEIERNFGVTVLFKSGCRIEIHYNDSDVATNEEPELYNYLVSYTELVVTHSRGIQCSPPPDDLTPCDNLMDPWFLRVCVWGLWILAVLGNVTVLFFTFISKEKMEVYQFLICCLAFADLCMGIYLAFLAATDVRTFGDVSFYQAALLWQLSAGCKTAGFMAVFGSELSVLILVVLTLERVHTIANALNQNEKGKKRVAFAAAIVCVLVAMFLAALPLVGINSYTKVAVCLPYLTKEWTDRMYIGLLLTINLVGFLVILFSYLYIFRSICKSPAAHSKKKELTVAAGKISLLILTAFLCWMPIVVIGYLTLAGVNTVNSAQAKYLIVLVYPLNACLNPFIYAIFTRQFRQKVSIMCKCSKDQIGSLPNSRRSQLKRGSSAFLPGSSSHASTPLELINLRHSRRSYSFSGHHVSHSSATPPIRSPPVLSPPPGVNMGRRSSLPAGFGSTLRQVKSEHSDSNPTSANNSATDVSAAASHPFNFAPGYLGVTTTSQPNLNEDEPSVDTPNNLQSSLGGSQESANRQLPDIPEEQEEENAYSSCSDDYCDASDDINDDDQVLPETVEVYYDMSASPSVSSVHQGEEDYRETSPLRPNTARFRGSVDSAYSGGNCATPEEVHLPSASPTHSCTLSRGSESFSSYDLTLSDSEGAGRESISAAPHVTVQQNSREVKPELNANRPSDVHTCLDSHRQITHSPSHESRGCRAKLKTPHLVPTNLESPHKTSSNSQISIVGSETSV